MCSLRARPQHCETAGVSADVEVKMRTTALTAALALALASCGAPAAPSDVQGTWQLSSGVVDGKQIPIQESHPVTMTLEDDSIGGVAACNSYGGAFALGPARSFEVGSLASTEMACMPLVVMEVEGMFLAGIVEADRITSGDGTLTVTGPDVEMTFTLLPPVATAELVGTVWILDGLIIGDAVTSVTGEEATLLFSHDGTFTAGTGCRLISGEYVIAGGQVQLTSFGAEGDCTAELSDQDSRVISALEGGFRVEIDGNRLTTWAAGDEGLAYVTSS